MDIKQILKEAVDEPSGVQAQATDGRLFFIPEAQADGLAVPKSGLYAAFRLVTCQPPVFAAKRSKCERVKRWLDTHSPHSAFWRSVCLSYFDECV
jgi:hypothetical protein